MTISELYDNAKRVSLEELFEDCVTDLEQEVIELNQKQMYNKGENANGTKIGEYNSPFYALEKNRMNPSVGFGNVDLKYSGKFYNSMYLYADKKGFFVDADVDYLDEIFEKYGEAMLGLSKTSLSDFVENYFQELFFQKLHQKLSA